MATLLTLTDNILPFAPGAPTAAAIWAYRRAAREFFTKTLAWRKELKFPAVAAEAQTPLDPGSDLEVFDAVQAWYGKSSLDKSTSAKSKRVLGVSGAVREPVYFRIEGVNSLVLAPAPPAAGEEISLLAVVRPNLSAGGIDDALIAKYGDTLDAGALAYLLRMPKKPWTDYAGAETHNDQFQLEIDKQTVIGVDGGVGTPRTVRYGGL